MFTIKNIILVLVLSFSFAKVYGQKIQSETTLNYDKNSGGVSIQRLQIDNPVLSVKYDYKIDLMKKNQVNDVFGIFVPNVIKTNDFSLDLAVIKVGDWDKNDEGFLDLTATKKFGKISTTVEIGRGVSSQGLPRDYVIARLSHDIFTVEAGLLSDHGYSDLTGFARNKYYWGAFHPKYVFLAVGSELTRTWLLGGTKDMKNFGNLSFVNIDRTNQNFWFRTQFGYGNINENFYCLQNYLVSTSYLVVPPFFYKHFSPISTKGDWTLKIDGIRTGNFEKYEVVGGHNFGVTGRVAFGWEREVPSENGFIFEYYKDFSISNFKAVFELKYESLYSRLSGFVTTSYSF